MGGGGGGKGGKGGGGGSGSIDVTSTSTSTIDSDSTSSATINSTSSSTSDITSNSTSNNQLTTQIAGLDNIRLKADTSADNKTALEMDLKPLQVDFCFKVGLERFPSTKICKPVSRHFGFTLFGVEVMGFNYAEDDKTVIEDLGNRPFVVSDPPSCTKDHHNPGPEPQGLRIRLAN